MVISDEALFRNANSYRLHQDILRWTLLAGYAAFLLGILSIESAKVQELSRIVLVAIGICYMLILTIENFFYNLFAEYVKDCESKSDLNEKLRTLKEFSESEVERIGPFHHSFVFALLIVLFGNVAITAPLPSVRTRIILYIMNSLMFILILLFWRPIVYPIIVKPIQKIFDISKKQKNIFRKFFFRFRKGKNENSK